MLWVEGLDIETSFGVVSPAGRSVRVKMEGSQGNKAPCSHFAHAFVILGTKVQVLMSFRLHNSTYGLVTDV